MMEVSADRAVRIQAKLRAQAESKRHMANLARLAGPGLSLAEDRERMRIHAEALEAEAIALDTQADALDSQR
jgi:hypothetical protein